MAGSIVRINSLPLLSIAPSTSVEFAIDDAGVTKKLTLDNLMTRVGSLSSLTSGITNTSIVNAINSIYALVASPSSKGLMTTSAQAFAGDKTFNNAVVLNGNQLSFASTVSPNYVVLQAGAAASSFYLTLPTTLPGGTSFLTINAYGAIAHTASVVTGVTAGTGLSGGTITSTGTLSLAASGVSTGTYGSAVVIPQIIVDSYGRITSAINQTIPTASGSVDGLLSKTNWTTFNNKLNTPSITSGSVPYWNGSILTENTDFKYAGFTNGDHGIQVPAFLNIGSEIASQIRTVNVSGNIDKTDRLLLVTPGGGIDVLLTLPDTSGLDVGQLYYFKVTNTGGGTIKVLAQGADQVDGAAEYSFSNSHGTLCVMYTAANTYSVLYVI